MWRYHHTTLCRLTLWRQSFAKKFCDLWHHHATPREDDFFFSPLVLMPPTWDVIDVEHGQPNLALDESFSAFTLKLAGARRHYKIEVIKNTCHFTSPHFNVTWIWTHDCHTAACRNWSIATKCYKTLPESMTGIVEDAPSDISRSVHSKRLLHGSLRPAINSNAPLRRILATPIISTQSRKCVLFIVTGKPHTKHVDDGTIPGTEERDS